MSFYSPVVYHGDGVTTDFLVPWPYDATSSVTATVDGVSTAISAWVTPSLARFAAAPGAGLLVKFTNAYQPTADYEPIHGDLGTIETTLVSISGQGALVIKRTGKQTFTRPNDSTPYSIGDLVANNTAAGSVTPLSTTGATISGNGGNGTVVGAVLSKTGNSVAQLRIHLFKASPAVTNGDNAAALATSLDQDNYIGPIDVSLTDPINGGVSGTATNQNLDYVLATGDTLYALVESLSAWTPNAQAVFTLSLMLRRYA